WDRGRTDSAREHLESGVRALAGTRSAELARLRQAQVALCDRVGDLAGMEIAVAELEALGGSPEIEVEAHLGRARLAWRRAQLESSMDAIERALAVAGSEP